MKLSNVVAFRGGAALAVLARVRGAGDAVFALAVLAVVLLLVAPLPPALLDVLLAANLAAALLDELDVLVELPAELTEAASVVGLQRELAA